MAEVRGHALIDSLPFAGFVGQKFRILKILALQLKRLGDLVMTTPALELLGREGEVTLGVYGSASELLATIPGLHGGIVFGKGKGWTPWQQVFWGRFDRVVDFTGTDRSALVTLLARAARRVTFDRAKSGWWRRMPYSERIDSPIRDQHTIEHYARLAGPLPEGEVLQPRLEVPVDALENARRLRADWGVPGEYALIHAGTTRPEKYWLAERWAEVIVHLEQKHGLRCIMTGGVDSAETAHLSAIEAAAAAAGVKPLNVAGRHDLRTLVALSSEARLILSVDTVMVHLGAAFQRRQVALFGPTNPFHWRPRHDRAAVFSAAAPEAPLTRFEPRLKGAPMERLSTALVIRATDGLLFP